MYINISHVYVVRGCKKDRGVRSMSAVQSKSLCVAQWSAVPLNIWKCVAVCCHVRRTVICCATEFLKTWAHCYIYYTHPAHDPVGHDSFICVTWFIHVCDMTHNSYLCVTWLIHVCDMTHTCVWHELTVTFITHTHCIADIWEISQMSAIVSSVYVSHIADIYSWHYRCVSYVWEISQNVSHPTPKFLKCQR